ncbi:MAG: formylglycine-generating enzyme family protein [Muribaculaceae bacterium]|nr:formylglycine-generating enzyme family protein [Muribaculaceae bacterium]
MRRLLLIIAGMMQSLILSALTNDLPDIEMVIVNGGTFTMGFDANEAEHAYEAPKHEVTLHDYKIGKYEVTQDLWEAVMGDNPSIFKGPDLPVENVSWNDVRQFIKKLNKLTGKHYRLPTEAEWEFAARGGNKSKGYAYIGGDEIDTTAWHSGNSDKCTHAVGSLTSNELGIFDMAGNVSEWTQDWFGHYSDKAQTNPKGPKSSDIGKIFRGGNCAILFNYNKPACRFVSNPNFKSSTIGFRLAE